MNIIITGKPGSGKGTQAALLAAAIGVPHISTGDIFRDEMKRGTPLGISITESMNAGQYTSDEITNAVVKERLQQPDVENGFILDGYPRTFQQVQFLLENDVHIDAVLNLEISRRDAMNRLLSRAQEQNRGDDTEAVILSRLDVYEETVPDAVEALYDNGVRIVHVSAIGKVREIQAELLEAIH